MEGKGLCGWGWGEAILGRGVSCTHLWGNVGWVLCSHVLCSHSLPQMWAVSHRSRVEGKQDLWQGFGEKELRLTKSLWPGPQCRSSHTRVKIAVS